jgi:hypothetical protein
MILLTGIAPSRLSIYILGKLIEDGIYDVLPQVQVLLLGRTYIHEGRFAEILAHDSLQVLHPARDIRERHFYTLVDLTKGATDEEFYRAADGNERSPYVMGGYAQHVEDVPLSLDPVRHLPADTDDTFDFFLAVSPGCLCDGQPCDIPGKMSSFLDPVDNRVTRFHDAPVLDTRLFSPFRGQEVYIRPADHFFDRGIKICCIGIADRDVPALPVLEIDKIGNAPHEGPHHLGALPVVRDRIAVCSE